MKQIILTTVVAGALLGSIGRTLADDATNQPPTSAEPSASTNAAATDAKPALPGPAPAADQTPPPLAPADADKSAAGFVGDKGLRMNFRGVSLETVLNYLSEAAGFIIVMDTEVKGKVDVWSTQPLNKDEAVSLLNTMLNKNGYAAIRNDRTLTIVSYDDAKKKNIPVKSGSNPEEIPKNEEIVTQILPVRTLNVEELAKDLQPILPSQGTLTPNDAGNALIVTDTQANIHHVAEIIKALDGSSVSTVRVFPLNFADAKSVASVLKDVFSGSDSSSSSGSSRSSSDLRSMFFDRMRGGGDPSGGGGEDRSSRRDRSSGGRTGGASNSKVVAVADDHSNSVIVSAPDDLMGIIEGLIRDVDTKVEDTDMRVFRLTYADPTETADMINSLYGDDTTKTDDNSRSGFSRFFSQPTQPTSTASSGANQSDRMKRLNHVVAVPDRRTASVIVTGATNTLNQIAGIIKTLDSNPARKQKVFVYTLENADVQDVEPILQSLFQSSTSSRNTSTSQNNNALQSRQTSAAQSTTASTPGFNLGTSGGQAGR